MPLYLYIDLVHCRKQELGKKLRVSMVVGVSRCEEKDVGRNRLLRGGPLRRHGCDDDVKNRFEFGFLKDEHLIMETPVPKKFLLVIQILGALEGCETR